MFDSNIGSVVHRSEIQRAVCQNV